MTCVSALPNPLDPTPFKNANNSSFPDRSLPHDNQDDSGISHTGFSHDESTDYTVVAELGAGLQGQVDLAYDKRHQRYVAVKLPTFVPHEGTSDVNLRHLDCQVQSILQERDAMRLVHHKNVLQFIRSMPGRKSHHAYVMLVIEYACNGDLFDIISQTGALSEGTSQFYFRQLLRGVQACHAAGVIHRDVKPENILFNDQFELKLCDFGLASIVPADHVNDAELFDVEGTQLYMAPEIDSAATFHGPPVDLWSCGIVLFIMLTGFPPFETAEIGDPWYDCILANDMAKFWASQPAAVTKPSPLAMDLISGLLQVDPARRTTVGEALVHPWLHGVATMDTTVVMQDMAERRQHCTLLSDEED